MEGTVTDQETRLTTVEENIKGKVFSRKIRYLLEIDQNFTRITCIYISGLQMTDVELDARVTALEESGGGGNGNGQNGKLILEFSHNYTKLAMLSFLF